MKKVRDQLVKLRVTEEEKQRITELAARAGMTVSKYIRKRILKTGTQKNK